MRDLIIGDIHFGIKSNSNIWFNLQKEYIEKQVIPLFDSHDRIIFLGDVFDIRYSTNTQIGCEIKSLIRKIADMNKPIYFIAGNHDYFSPDINFESYNSYELLFGEEFEKYHPNIHFITKLPLLDNGTLMLPWYYTEDKERWFQVMKEYKNQFNRIYCHSDLSEWDKEMLLSKGNDTYVYSGHIHYPWSNPDFKLYNVGASCALTFNDVNSSRYIYTIEDNKIIATWENTTTPSFKRFFNDRIFTLNESDFKNSITQIIISTDNATTARYIERMNEIKKEYCENNQIKFIIVDNDQVTDLLDMTPIETNIHEYIKNSIPDHLKEKFNILDNKIKDK